MKIYRVLFLAVFLLIFAAGCDDSWDGGGGVTITTPTVTFTAPLNNTIDVYRNMRISATFSEAMRSSTIERATAGTTGTFTLAHGSTAVSGTVAYTGVTAVFTPEPAGTLLEASTVYTATITTAAKSSAGRALAATKTWTFTTGTTTDTTPPTVSSTVPLNDAVDVPLNQALGATFSEAMDPLTINSTTFTLAAGGTTVSGTVTYAGLTAVFIPTSNLTASTLYTATITTGVADLMGNYKAANKVWTFTTGTAADTTAPTVSSTVPANEATDVPTNLNISAAFSEAMNPLTITDTTFTLTGPGTTPVAGAVTYVLIGSNAIFNPDSDLAADTLYTATITTGATDLAGNAVASSHVWTFTTAAGGDTTAPTVVLPTSPADGDIDVFLNRQITATFSEDMDPTTMNTTNWSLTEPGTAPVPLDGDFDYDLVTRIATFIPTSDLLADTTYTATLTTGMKDLAGNALANDEVWTFTTGTIINPAVVPGFAIGDTLQPYGVLAGTAVTLAGAGTRVDGDVGISPGSTCNGCDTSTVTGTINIANDPAVAAKVALIAAYDNAKDRATNQCTLIAGGDLALNPPPPPSLNCYGSGNGTFPPGLYWSGTSISIGVGATITLDAQNDANAVFIFQAESTIGSLANSHIILANGALAKNVFWVAGSSATVGGVGSDFAGTVIALSDFTVSGGTEMEGRALARNGSLTVEDLALITVPTP